MSTALAIPKKARRCSTGERFERESEDVTIRRLVYEEPDPCKVAQLLDRGYGIEACLTRWPGIGVRTLMKLACVGRAQMGITAQSNGRARSETPEREAAAVAAAFVLSSSASAEVAAGFKDAYLQRVFDAFGITDRPRMPWSERGRNTMLGRLAIEGDAEAQAQIDRRRAHDRAVFEVCLAALALLPLQTRGRPVMPPPSPELDAILAGHDAAAVAAVFPDRPAQAPPVPHQETVDMPPKPRTRVPDESVIRAAIDEGLTVNEMADRWGVTSNGVRYALKKLGLTVRLRVWTSEAAPIPSPATNVLPFVPAPVPAPEPDPDPSIGAPSQPGRTRLLTRLDVDGLAAAVALARAAGLDPLDALEWVRADAALALQDARHLQTLMAAE